MQRPFAFAFALLSANPAYASESAYITASGFLASIHSAPIACQRLAVESGGHCVNADSSFALLYFHGGESDIIESGLTAPDCLPLSNPGNFPLACIPAPL